MTADAATVRLRVRVQPRASRTELAGEHDGALKVRLAASPVGGDANRELVRFVAKTLGVALLVAQMGKGQPAEIRARILQSADDLGEPGTDPFYGKGRINIARALGLID